MRTQWSHEVLTCSHFVCRKVYSNRLLTGKTTGPLSCSELAVWAQCCRCVFFVKMFCIYVLSLLFHMLLTTEKEGEGETPKSTIQYSTKARHTHSNGTTAPSRRSFPALFAMLTAVASSTCPAAGSHKNVFCIRMQACKNMYYTRIGSNKGKTPEHNQAKHTKHPHSLEWHNSTITIVFPSTLRNTLVVMTKHHAMTPNQSTTQKLRNT